MDYYYANINIIIYANINIKYNYVCQIFNSA